MTVPLLLSIPRRTGTPAAAMEDQVPDDVVKDRFDRLLKEVQQISAEVCSVHQGTTQDVLVENVNDHDPSSGDRTNEQQPPGTFPRR